MAKKIIKISAALLFLLSAYLIYDYFSFIDNRNALVKKQGQETTTALRNQVDALLVKISDEGKRLAELFGSNEYSQQEIEQMIRESSLSIPEIQGVTACFEPYAFSPNRQLFCPYYNKGTQNYLYVEESYDYSDETDPGTAWYTSVRDKGAKWVEPYYARGAQDWYVDYGIPFHYTSGPNKGKVKGTITMSFLSGGFKNLVHSLSIGKTGYGIITSNKGTFLAHPIDEYVGTVSLDSLMKIDAEATLNPAYVNILNGEVGDFQFYDHNIKDQALFFYDQIPSSGWGIGLMFFKHDILGDSISINRKFIHIALAISLLLVCLLAMYFIKDHLDEGEIWQLSAVSTFLLLANVFLIGYLQHSTNTRKNETHSPPIIDHTSVSRFLQQQHVKAKNLRIPKSIPIPTGIYIQKLEFEDSYNLNVGGTVWQKYPLDIVDDVNVGFNMPQMSPFAEASYIEESYRKVIDPKEDEEGYLLVGWDVRVTLKLSFNYSDFPFDKRHINIELVPLNNNDHLIFTPDIDSYQYTNPNRKSGLSKKIQISGSEVLESYFNYSLETYDADFGYGQSGLFQEVPVLHFNIHLRRNLLNAFITYLIPIFVTLAMVFILLISCTKTSERQGVIESMAAFFFVLIFSHIDLRKEVITADLIYMEHFYFISYFMLILATFNLIIFTKDKSNFFDYNENQVFKALFYPLFFLALLMITLIKFY